MLIAAVGSSKPTDFKKFVLHQSTTALQVGIFLLSIVLLDN
jgi:hypothetical protein